jgi:energy-coupling factor transporter ATP-binding protein EcfA2
MRFGPHDLRLDSLFSGVAAVGATGSGKTTFLELLLRAVAEHPSRPGMVWCCCKSDEADRAVKVARKAGRSADVVRFAPDSGHALDLFSYLRGPLRQSSDGVARFLDRLAGLAVQNQGSGDDKTWQVQAQLMLTAGLDLFSAAGEAPTPQSLFDVIVSVAKDPPAAASDEFLLRTACGQLIVRGQKRHAAKQLSATETAKFERAVSYMLTYAPGLGDRFLGSVIGSAVTGLGQFLHEPFASLFGSGRTTLPPDVLLDGAIVVLDLPSALGPAAYVAQAAYTQLAQMLLLASPRGNRRPVVIVRDEAQWLVSPDWDAKVQTIARSHGIVSITAVQGHPPLIDAFGGNEAARVRALAFLGSHATHLVFNPAADADTRDHYVRLFGTSRQLLFNGGQQPDPHPGFLDQVLGCEWTPTVGWGEQLLPVVPPEAFGRLRRGGAAHDYRVQAFLYEPGRDFGGGHPFTLVDVAQDLTP